MKLSDPDANVYVNRDGTIRYDGEPIGFVGKVEVDSGFSIAGMSWRAELGDARKPEQWPPYRAVYDRTRKGAVAGVFEGVEIPAEFV